MHEVRRVDHTFHMWYVYYFDSRCTAVIHCRSMARLPSTRATDKNEIFPRWCVCVCMCVWEGERATSVYYSAVNYHGIVVCRRCVRSLEKRKLYAGLDTWYGMVVISFASGVSFCRSYEGRDFKRLVNGSKCYEIGNCN